MKKRGKKFLADEKVKNLGWMDIQFIKLAVVFFVLFVVSFLSNYFDKIVDWRWVWFLLFVVFSLKPFLKTFGSKKNKGGALELSVGTIVIIVIAITMLILGIVLVRSIMCGAIGLTSDLNDRVKGEINDLFGATGGEIQCIGSRGEPVKMQPGETNIVYCGFSAPGNDMKYSAIVDYSGGTYITEGEMKSWVRDETWGPISIAPGDDLPKKVIRVDVPDNAPEDTITFQVEFKRNGELISTQELDFEISRTGFFKAAMC